MHNDAVNALFVTYCVYMDMFLANVNQYMLLFGPFGTQLGRIQLQHTF